MRGLAVSRDADDDGAAALDRAGVADLLGLMVQPEVSSFG